MNKIVKTRLNERSERVETNLTLDFQNVTEDQLQELASRAAIIAWQSKVRAEGEIPTEATFNVAEVFDRKPRTPKNARFSVRLSRQSSRRRLPPISRASVSAASISASPNLRPRAEGSTASRPT